MKKDDNGNGNGNGNCQNSDDIDIKVCGTGVIDVDVTAEAQACEFEIFNVESIGENIISYNFCAIVTLKGSIDAKAEPPIITSVTPENED
jgi:hypothetical protein